MTRQSSEGEKQAMMRMQQLKDLQIRQQEQQMRAVKQQQQADYRHILDEQKAVLAHAPSEPQIKLTQQPY